MAPPATDAVAAKSAHVADPALVPFLHHDFDPAQFLNSSLPSLSLGTASSRPLNQGPSASLADLSSQTQQLLAQLSAHTTRLSTILTQLTDDILRSGVRLAYEVEVLHGETATLTETLSDGLNPEITRFVPNAIPPAIAPKHGHEPGTSQAKSGGQNGAPPSATQEPAVEAATDAAPDYMSQLRVLSLVRSRLESVIKVFGEAMHWTIPPSEISLTSSLISVSAPEPGSDASSREQKGREFAAALRNEIADLVTGDAEGGIDAANTRIQALKDLAQVWKGTAEEKARGKFVESLVRLAEEKQKEADRERERKQRGSRSGSVPKPATQPPAPQRSGGGGFLDNLQRIRENYI